MALQLSFIGIYGVDFSYHNCYMIHLFNGAEKSKVFIGSHVSRKVAKSPNGVPIRTIDVKTELLTELPDNPTRDEYITHAYAYLIHRELKGAVPVLEEGQSLPEGFYEWYAIPEPEPIPEEEYPTEEPPEENPEEGVEEENQETPDNEGE